jgi:hypothetical protein
MTRNNPFRSYLAVATLMFAAAMGACSTDEADTPSAPSGPSVPSAPTTQTWSVAISVSPSQLELPEVGSVDPVPTSTVTFTVRRQSDGSLAPTGLTLVATVTGGTLAAPLCPGSTFQYCLALSNGVATTVFTPTAEGTATITASVDGGNTTQSQILVGGPGEGEAFLLSHVNPSVVDPSGGDVVTIFGNAILTPVRVLVDGTQAQVVDVDSTSIDIVVPPSTAAVPVGTTRPVTVTVVSGVGTVDEKSDSLTNGLVYAQGGNVSQPEIFSVTPTTGPPDGHTPITINGRGFLSPVQVIFRFATPGSSPLDLEAKVTNVTSSQIRVESPDITTYADSGALANPISATVRVINLNNGFFRDAGQQFFYGNSMRITSVTPGEGSYVGGEQARLTGNGFDEPLTVSIGGIGQQVVSVTGTQIVFRTVGPVNAACGSRAPLPIRVTLVEGGASAEGPSFTFVGPPNPRIFGLSPNAGGAGTVTTISGDGFDAPVRVQFGGADGSSAVVTSVTPTSIVATVPTPPPGFSFDTEACDGNGDNIPGGTRNIPTRISVSVTNLDNSCTTTLSNAFTINPQDTACSGDESEPPPPPTVQCNDGFDNDGDTLIDAADPQCTGPTDNSEST